MSKIALNKVTLIGIDCIDIDRLVFASDVCEKFIEFAGIKLLSSLPNDDPHVVRIDAISSMEAYSWFVMKELYKYVDTEYALLIQWDGFILNPFCWRDEFLSYDYIGATWWYKDAFNVGNGGFSIRSRRLMETLATDAHITSFHPEDIAICRTYGPYLRSKGFRFASEDVANQFSTESLIWNGQFGFHASRIDKWDIHRFTDCEKHAKYITQFYDRYKRNNG
jgi:hypothetical protein